MEEAGNKLNTSIGVIFSKVGKVTDIIEVSILSLGTLALAVLLVANVIARKFFRCIYYAEEVSMILILIVTFVGVSYAARKGRHIRMGAIFDAVGTKWPGVQKVMIYIISAYSALIMFLMTHYTYNALVITRKTKQVTPSLGIRYWVLYIVVIAGFLLAGIQYLRTIYKNILEKEVWISPEQKGEYDEEG